MGRGYPYVHVCHYIGVIFDKSTTPPTCVGQKEWWAVDGGFIGRCGHNHKTEEAAKKCLKPMLAKYRTARYPKRKKG